MDDKVIVRTVFAETQLFKRAENYFTDSLLYREVNKVIKELLSDSIDSGNAADSESEEDTHAAFAMKSIVTYLNESDCNDSVENDVEWVINKNVSFDSFVCLNDVLNSVKSSSLHMPLPTARMACMQTEDNDESIFIVPSSTKNQSPIVFGKVYLKTFTLEDPKKEQEPPHFFDYTWSVHCIMKRMGYDLRHGNSLNFEKG